MTDEGAIEKTERGHDPRSLANLRSWQPGQSGNPTGMKQAVGVSVERWKVHLQDKTVPDLERIYDDPKTPAVKRAAAADLLVGSNLGRRFVKGKDGEVHEAATDPEPGRVRERMADRGIGKPVQSLHVTTEKVSKPAEYAADLIALLRSDPRYIEPLGPKILEAARVAPTIREQLRPILQQHAPELAAALDVVDTVARELAEPTPTVPADLVSPAEYGSILAESLGGANQPAAGESDPVPAPAFPDAEEAVERSRLPYTPPQPGRRLGG